MTQFFVRLGKRLAVLIPGIIIAYFSVRNVFPFFDKRVPDTFAVIITYIIAAYILIPALIRLVRIIHPPKHLPLYCVTPDGFASDPLNIGIIGTRLELIRAMQKAGWHVADPHTPRHMLRHGLSIVYGWSYPNAPVSSLYLFGRKQDMAFEIPREGEIASRHHVRFWATTYDPSQKLNFETIHWHHSSGHGPDEQLLWVGAASLDVGVSYIRHNFQVTHMIDPDTNRERDMIVGHLKAKGLADKIETAKLGEPYQLINRVLRGWMHSDGNMDIVRLRKPAS